MPKRKAPSKSEAVVGFAWYSLRDWVRLKSAADDPEGLHETYVEWVKQAETSIATLRSAGVDVRRVPVDMTELEGWCREHNVPNTGANRAMFVAEKARKGLFLLPE